MSHMIIDGRKVEFTDEKNVLSVIRKAGINIPTLCYHSELSTFGACRLCTVEDDRGKMFASCSEEPKDGMVIHTNSGRIRKYRKLIVELLLAAHCRDCTTCVKSGECVLQELAHRLGVENVRFQNTREQRELDLSSPSLVRDPNKCILCGNCVRACEELQGIGALGFAFRGTEAMVMPAFDRKISTTDCVNCGQCRVFCPTGAISIRTNMDEVWEALADPNVRVVAQVAPAVRVAVGDHYGLTKGKSVMGKIVNALHLMGFDEVYDTSFSADLTIMEESAEFLDRIKKGEKLPLLTSCCPAWSVMAKKLFPDHANCISMALTPMTLTARLIKKHNPNAKVVFIGPCAAKKLEAIRRSVRSEVDFVLTFEEMAGIFDAKHVDLENMEEDPDGVSDASTDGRNFAVAGGVAQAVVDVIKRDHPEQEIKVANAEGLKECRQLLKLATLGKYPGYLLEGMACPGGCVAGAGTMQAIKKSQTAVGLYAKKANHQFSSETEYIKELDKLVD